MNACSLIDISSLKAESKTNTLTMFRRPDPSSFLIPHEQHPAALAGALPNISRCLPIPLKYDSGWPDTDPVLFDPQALYDRDVSFKKV
jgi:hypothetical protein